GGPAASSPRASALPRTGQSLLVPSSAPQDRTASDGIAGQSMGPHVKAQGMGPTSHWAILRASPMLQAPSPFTSHSVGYGIAEQARAPTSNCAINRASPMFTTPSPFTSPQEKGPGTIPETVPSLPPPRRTA